MRLDMMCISMKGNCRHCGSSLGLDCGDAEPDYNEYYCSRGCQKKDINNLVQSFPMVIWLIFFLGIVIWGV